MNIPNSVDTVNIRDYYGLMARSTAPRPRRKRAGHYHHGDLRRALLEQALQTIQAGGIEQVTLRAVGEKLGVSRTALYRHFSDKQALLAAVGTEGFRMLRQALTDAWSKHGGGRAGFEAMGIAYVQFASVHPAHYRVMFGRFIESCSKDAELVQEASAAFQVLVDAVVEQQQAGLVRQDDPLRLARFDWAVVHGIAMLEIDGQLRGDGEALSHYAAERLRDATRASVSA